MGLQTSFDILSRIVDHYESHDRSIQHVDATPTGENGDQLAVVIEVPLTLCSGSAIDPGRELSPESAALTEDNGLQIEFSASSLLELPETTEAALSTDNTDICVTDDGLLLTVAFTIDPSGTPNRMSTATDNPSGDSGSLEPAESSGKPDSTTVSIAEENGTSTAAERDSIDEALFTARDTSIPPYDDVDYLQELYNLCDNFTEMSERITMDVSSETVRRYMIQANVHEPHTYETPPSVSDDMEDTENTRSQAQDETQPDQPQAQDETQPDQPQAQDETQPDQPQAQDEIDLTASHTLPVDEQLATDGIGLPDGIEITEIIDAVADSMTVYEVMNHLELNRRETSDILKELNLLDLVSRPLSYNPDEPISHDMIASRIRQCEAS